MCGFFYSNMSYMTNNATIELMRELDESVQRVKELNRIINRLESSIICESDSMEDLIELTRTYAQYSIRELESSYLHVWNKVVNFDDNIVPFPVGNEYANSKEDS